MSTVFLLLGHMGAFIGMIGIIKGSWFVYGMAFNVSYMLLIVAYYTKE